MPKTSSAEVKTAPSPSGSDMERPWQPWERNFSGGRLGVQEQQGTNENWMILHVESGGAKTTTSLRYHEAWDLALMVSPQVKARLEELFTGRRAAEAALWQFKYADTIAPLLRKIADDWTCDYSCERAGSSTCHERDDGCRFVEAEELREFATALELRATLAKTQGEA